MSIQETSRFLSYILRHEPQSIGLSLSPEGWLSIDLLIEAATRYGHNINRQIIDSIVQNSDKKRFAISIDGTMIRALQGHTVMEVDITFEIKEPPACLYHGTSTRFLESILQYGLEPMARQYVHLSNNLQTAFEVGQRYGKVAVLKIDAFNMCECGYKFWQAENGVWLVKNVPVKFISLL